MILGVGIYYHANLWPDHRAMWSGDLSNWSIWKIIYYPYWQLYGEFNLDVLDGNAECFSSKFTYQVLIIVSELIGYFLFLSIGSLLEQCYIKHKKGLETGLITICFFKMIPYRQQGLMKNVFQNVRVLVLLD